MWLNSLQQLLVRFWATVTIDPIIFLYCVGWGVVFGSEVQTNLLMWKICHIVLGHNETVCADLEKHETVQNEVQVYTNDFQMVLGIVVAIPGICFCLFAGALSDKYGRKPLLICPLSGLLLSSIFRFFNYAYIREVPLGFFYLEQFYYFFGGMSIYYMGMYGYGSDITTEQERTSRLARFDGLEMGGYVFGTFLSPRVFAWGGNYACYSVELILVSISLFYLIFFVEESRILYSEISTPNEKKTILNTASKVSDFLDNYCWEPLKGFIATMLRKREGSLQRYLYVLLVIYLSYWLVLQYTSQIIPGFNGEQNAHVNVFTQLVGIFCLLVLVPIFSGKMALHESTLSLMINICVTVGMASSACVSDLWPGWYLSRTLTAVDICYYSIARSLFTKLVGPDEVGKVFSAVALIAAVSPMLTGPLFREVYNATIETNPAAFIWVAFGFYVVSTTLWVYLFWCRKDMVRTEEMRELNVTPIKTREV